MNRSIFYFPIFIFIVLWISYSMFKEYRITANSFNTAIESREVDILNAIELGDRLKVRSVFFDIRDLGASSVELKSDDNIPQAFKNMLIDENHKNIFNISFERKIAVNGLDVGTIEAKFSVYKLLLKVLSEESDAIFSILLIAIALIELFYMRVRRQINLVHKLVSDSTRNLKENIYSDQSLAYVDLASTKDELTISILALLDEQKKIVDSVSAASAMAKVASQVAHDIRSPLSVLNILARTGEDVSNERGEMLRAVIARINGIADDLLSRSKDGASSASSVLVGNQESFDADYDIVLELNRLIQEKTVEYSGNIGVKIESRFPGEIDKVKTDFPLPMLKRIISNLINNAVEATIDYGTIYVEILNSHKHFIVRIVDFGRGIPPEVLEKLTVEPVSYGKDKSSKSGTGIGVYSAFQELKKYGGRLQIESKVDLGTQVSVILPTKV